MRITFACSTASVPSPCRLAPRQREGGKRWRYSRRPLPIAPRGRFRSRATRCSGIASSPASSALPPHRSRARASRVVRRTPRVADAGFAAHRAPHRCPLKRRGGSEPPGPPAAFPQSPYPTLVPFWTPFGGWFSHPGTRNAGKGVRTALYRQAQLPCISKSYRSVTRASPIPL